SVSIGLFGPVHSPAVAADAKPVNNPATSTVEARSRTKFAIATRCCHLPGRSNIARSKPDPAALTLTPGTDRKAERRFGASAAVRVLARPGRFVGYSICAPDALMMGDHFASSVLTNSAVVSGVLPGVGSMPAFSSAVLTAGSPSALLIAALSLSTIGFGVRAGARSAFQV